MYTLRGTGPRLARKTNARIGTALLTGHQETLRGIYKHKAVSTLKPEPRCQMLPQIPGNPFSKSTSH